MTAYSQPEWQIRSFTKDDFRRLASRIAEQRKARGWNQREASQRAGIQADRLSRLERGAEPGIDEVSALSRAFGMGLEELLYGAARAGDELDLLAREMLTVLPPEDFRAILRIFRTLVAGYRVQAAS